LTEHVWTNTVPERLAGTPVLAGRFDLDREAVCPAGGLGGSIPLCQAHGRAGQAPARPVLRLCGPLIPEGAAAVGQRPGRRLASQSKDGPSHSWWGTSPSRCVCPRGCGRCGWVDRGIARRPLVQSLDRLGQYSLGRVRSNQVFYFAPRRQPKRGRPRSYGQKCRVDQWVKRTPSQLRHQSTALKIRGKERSMRV
jgi:hypothetical protein